MAIERIIKEEFRLRLIDEGLVRIKKCMSLLSDDELWIKPSSKTNSVGNLILHLEGNVRQYIISGVGGHKDTRNRDSEFDSREKPSRAVLLKAMKRTLAESETIVFKLSLSDLSREETVQGFKMTVLSCLIHVIEHFSYHVGQITFYTKMLKDVDTGYYEGMDLNQKRD